MKAATTTLINFLENATTYVRADLYTFTLNSGAVLRYTSANAPVTTTITVNGATQGPYTWNVGPPISDEGVQSSRGVNAASVDITINGGTGIWTVNGLDILDFIDGFGLDGASVRIDRARAPDWPTMFGSGPIGTHCRFSGLFTEAKELGETQAVVTVQDPRSVLQTQYPAEVYSTSCLNSFGDANCSVNVAALTVSGAVISSDGSQTQLTFDTNLTQASGYFTLGVITFTSGENAGVSRSIKTYSQSGGVVDVTAPLPAVPAVGDAFTISPGCSLALSSTSPQGCQQWQPSTWQNRFRGQPFVPPPTTGLPT
jgi:hypothetical protein